MIYENVFVSFEKKLNICKQIEFLQAFVLIVM